MNAFDPDEFGKAMLGRARPCHHGRLRALRECEFCDWDERPVTHEVKSIACADWYTVRLTLFCPPPVVGWKELEGL